MLKKGFGNLSLVEAQKLQNLFPNQVGQVYYLNKIGRLRFLVTIQDGLICNGDGEPISMTELSRAKLFETIPYAMDKYGNLYVMKVWWGERDYVEKDMTGGFSIKQTTQFNHSTFLGGAGVVCAGTLHIGLDNRNGKELKGSLSAIDNSSGHYKPTAEHLRNCLQVLKAQGVNVDRTRVGDFGTSPPTYYWGIDFLAGGRHPWPSFENPSSSFYKAPKIAPSI
jgi:hypothetical protein